MFGEGARYTGPRRPRVRAGAHHGVRPPRRAARAGWVAAEESVGYRAAPPPSPRSPRGREAAERLERCVTTPGSALGAALGALADAVEALGRVDVDGEHPDVVGDALVALNGLHTRLHGRVLSLLDSFDRREGWAADGALTASSWLAGRTGTDHTAAHNLVHSARRLRRLPRLAAHLAAGDITAAHASAVTRAAVPHRFDAISASQDTLADLACTNPPRDLRHALRRLADIADPDGSQPGHDQPPGADPLRELALRRGYQGRGELLATLDPLTREALTTLLDAFDSPDPADTPTDQRRSFAQRRHDAFAAMLHTLLAQPGLPTVQGARPHILITIDLHTLLGLPPDHPNAHLTLADLAEHLGIDLTPLDPTPTGHTASDPVDAEETHPSTTPTGAADTHDADLHDVGSHDAGSYDADGAAGPPTLPPADPAATPPPAGPARPPPSRPPRFGSGVAVSPALIRGLLPAATIMAVLTLGPWRVVNVGSVHRTLPAWLRTVMVAMHHHCRGPDCDHPANWTEAHHIIPWAKARTTDLNQTLPACCGHHKLTEKGWHATLDHTTGHAIWTSPTGRTITVPPPQPRPDETPDD